MEDGYHYLYEDESIPQLEEGYFKYPTGEIEYTLVESTGHHLKFEDDDHVIYEDLSRMVMNDLEFKTPDITKHYVTEESGSDLQRWTPANHELTAVETDADRSVEATYGLQLNRPRYISQWAATYRAFIDTRFELEDDSGNINLEHDVVSTDFLQQEDFPELGLDLMNLQREVLDAILTEDRDTIIVESGLDGDRLLLLETSRTPAEGFGVEFTPHQAWTWLPAYQYLRQYTRLRGTVSLAEGATAMTGDGTHFSTQFRVGDEFSTSNENIITEDTGGGVLLETDERIEHEELRVFHVQNLPLATDLLGSEIRNFRWFITTEDTTIAAHGTQTGVTGAYSVWDTAVESYWLLAGDTNSELGLSTETNTEGYPGGIEREAPEWENNNMLWEDGSQQLVTEPQAFMVGSITNDISLTVTRISMPGGVTDSVYQM